MGSKIQKQAQQLGLMNARHITLYAIPRKLRMGFGKSTPDVIDAIRDYLALQDATVILDKFGGGQIINWDILAPKAQTYVEAIIDQKGAIVVKAVNPSNMAVQINIYANNDQVVRGIAKAVNVLFEDGMLAHLEFKKFEEKFQVKQEAVIAEWKKWL
jgi:hypothetical protein